MRHLMMFVLLIALLTGCSPTWISNQVNFVSLYNGPDQPLTEETLVHLEGSQQSRVTPAIQAAAPLIMPGQSVSMARPITVPAEAARRTAVPQAILRV